MDVFYSDEYAAAEHAFETTRKARWIAESLRASPIQGVELTAPRPVTAEVLRAVHDPEYVDAVRTGEPRALAQGQGFSWDPRLWDMVCASNGGAVAAARRVTSAAAVSGSLSSGLHHARRERGYGFCTFNGLALAALAAQGSVEGSVLILDLDAHCGGGTQSLLRDDPAIWHVDVSVCHYDGYSPPNDRFTLDVVERADDYLPLVKRRLDALEEVPFALCLYNAGMDPFELDPSGLSGLDRGLLEARERLVFSWCRARSLPVAFVLAGGYLNASRGHDEASLVELHRLTIAAAADAAR